MEGGKDFEKYDGMISFTLSPIDILEFTWELDLMIHVIMTKALCLIALIFGLINNY